LFVEIVRPKANLVFQQWFGWLALGHRRKWCYSCEWPNLAIGEHLGSRLNGVARRD
jgi:hypothetical protein